MSGRAGIGRVALAAGAYAVMAFLFIPIAVTMVVAVNSAGFVLPPRGLTLKWFEIALASREFTSGIVVSLILGLAAATLANILGLMIALAMVRHRFRGKQALNLLVMSPILVPVTIFGLALYVFLARLGLGGGLLTLIIGHTVLVMPFAVRILTASLQNFDRSLEEASLNVGAGPLRTLFAITLPIIRSGVLASFILCFIISWNDFALSVFLAPSSWIPLPIQIYSYIKFQYDAAGAALVTLLILFSALVIILLDRLVGLRSVMGREARA